MNARLVCDVCSGPVSAFPSQFGDRMVAEYVCGSCGDTWFDTDEDWEGHSGCVMPAGVSVGFGTFGTFRAVCDCGFACASWDCVCELAHDCALSVV